jgi:hypothetical protein
MEVSEERVGISHVRERARTFSGEELVEIIIVLVVLVVLALG